MSTAKRAILLSCGSFNPPTVMHLRLFELAKDQLSKNGYDVLGGIMSPVHDKYKEKKSSLISAHHRINMVELSLKDYHFVKCSKWETQQEEWTRTRQVLEQHLSQIKEYKTGSTNKTDFSHLPKSLNDISIEQIDDPDVFRVFFICGGDLLESFSVPNLWKNEDIESIVKNFGLCVITREGSNPQRYIENHAILKQYCNNIHIITERIANDISSTKIRDAVKQGSSIKFFVTNPVITYIHENLLYR